jgi:hypothetical protein
MHTSLQTHPASFDKLRMRENLTGTKKIPHPELVEGRRSVIPSLLPAVAGMTLTGEAK